MVWHQRVKKVWERESATELRRKMTYCTNPMVGESTGATTFTTVTPDSAGRSAPRSAGQGPPATVHLKHRHGSFRSGGLRHLQIRSFSVQRPASEPLSSVIRDALFHINLHSPPSLASRPRSIRQNGPVLHRVRHQGRLPLRECPRRNPPPISRSCKRGAGGFRPIGDNEADDEQLIACHGCLGRPLQWLRSRSAWWRQQGHSGSPNQCIELRRG